MKRIINVLVIEDNENFNNLLLDTLKQVVRTEKKGWDFRFFFYSFTDAANCAASIRSGKFADNESIAFIDYYLGTGINGTHIIKMLREQPVNATIVLISQSKSVREKVDQGMYDFFVLKDDTAPALCCLCFEQYLDNKVYSY